MVNKIVTIMRIIVITIIKITIGSTCGVRALRIKFD